MASYFQSTFHYRTIFFLGFPQIATALLSVAEYEADTV